MIIGNGSLAKILKDREKTLFFASGVSDSSMKSYDGFQNPESQREHKLLFEWTKTANHERLMFVYFSTISKFTKATPYTLHKNTMEFCVRDLCERYCIVRIGNIWECTNPKTFINYIKAHPDAEIREKEMKYMISKKQLGEVTDGLPKIGGHEISVFGELLTVKECLRRSASSV